MYRIYIYVYLSIYLYIYIYIYLSIYLSIYTRAVRPCMSVSFTDSTSVLRYRFTCYVLLPLYTVIYM